MSDNFAANWQKTHEQLLIAYRQSVTPTADEVAVLQSYVGVTYKYVAEYLWTGRNKNPFHTRLVLDIVRNLDSLMSRSIVPTSVVAYRRAELNSAFHLTILGKSEGGEYAADGFESTSLNPYLGGHGRGVLAAYKIPAGVHAVYVPAFASKRSAVAMVENELLLDRGLHWRVATKQTKLDKSVSVVLELFNHTSE